MSRRHPSWWGAAALIAAMAAALGACGDAREPAPAAPAPGAAPRPAATTTPAPPSPTTAAPAPGPATAAAARPADRDAEREPAPPSLAGNKRNAWAFAPLDRPGRVTLEGSVPLEKAYSTSKVLVVCAFVATVAGGDPGALTSGQRELIRRALTASDMDALLQLQYAVPGGAQAPITRILRGIGDTETAVPASTFGGMLWSPREQVRFMAALSAGRVVNARTSRYVLSQMHPIPAHSWGLGRIGATAYKGGWLRPDTDTRQMGIVDGYAVAIITYAVGPAVLQTDGDYAHVEQMNRLAGMLQRRLAAEGG